MNNRNHKTYSSLCQRASRLKPFRLCPQSSLHPTNAGKKTVFQCETVAYLQPAKKPATTISGTPPTKQSPREILVPSTVSLVFAVISVVETALRYHPALAGRAIWFLRLIIDNTTIIIELSTS